MIGKFRVKLSGDKHLQELLLGSLNSSVLQALGIIISYVNVFYITHYYGAASYGTIVLLLSAVGVFVIISNVGTRNQLMRIVSELSSYCANFDIVLLVKKNLLFTGILSLISATLLYVGAEFIAKTLFHKAHLTDLFKLIAIVVVTKVTIGIMSSFFQGLKKIKTLGFVNEIIAKAVLLALLLNTSTYTLEGLARLFIYADIITMLMTGVLLLLSCRQLNREKEQNRRPYPLKKLLEISIPIYIGRLFLMIIQFGSILILSTYATQADIGIYSVAQKTAGLVAFFLMAVNSIAAPKFAEFYGKNDLAGLAKIAQQSTKMVFLLSTPVLIILMVFPHFILGLFGDEFVAGYLALILLTLAQLINVFSGSVALILNMTNQHKTMRNIMVLSALINVVLNYALIPLYGINGAAFAVMTSTIFINIVPMIIIRRKFGFWTASWFKK